ncbi:MAG TPA: hypothetical protein VK404_11670 [Spirosoma sp.]|nr:hypothetical protein [Spirosoma sp.]
MCQGHWSLGDPTTGCGRTIYVPYHTTAHHERVSGDGYFYRQGKRIQDVVALIQ